MEIFRSLIRIIPVLGIALCTQFSYSQPCTIEIPPEQQKVDGISLGIKPGDTICLLPGNRGELRLENLTGAEGRPVTIINNGRKVIIHTTAPSGIAVSNSVHIRITGSGGQDRYGIEIASTGSQGVTIGDFSSHIEADHLEIHHVGFAGIMAKTDPNCSRKDLRYFIMKNISFHDNYIYEAKGEGFYVGYSWYPVRKYKCGADSLLYPHEIHGVRIYNNIIRNTHWDGLQVGSSTRDVKIYNNTIDNYGLDNKLWQDHGVQIGAGTTGDFFNNRINTGAGAGISFFGSGDNRLYNNLFLNTGNLGIYHNDGGAAAGKSYWIINNTIINPNDSGIWLNAARTRNNIVANNIVIAKTPGAILGVTDRWTLKNNMVFSSVAEAGFLFPDTLNFTLKKESAAVDKGATIDWLNFDHTFGARPAGKSFDAGAFEYHAQARPVPVYPFEENGPDMVIDPQPVPAVYTFAIPAKGNEGDFSCTVYDGAGRIVKNESFERHEKSVSLNTATFSSGIYYAAVLSGGRPVALRRFIKQ
jgi:hypothetical protein